jgi:hypothetical protein
VLSSPHPPPTPFLSFSLRKLTYRASYIHSKNVSLFGSPRFNYATWNFWLSCNCLQFAVMQATHSKTLSLVLLYPPFTKNDLITSLNKPCTMPWRWRQSDITARCTTSDPRQCVNIFTFHGMTFNCLCTLYQTSVPDKQLFVAASNL